MSNGLNAMAVCVVSAAFYPYFKTSRTKPTIKVGERRECCMTNNLTVKRWLTTAPKGKTPLDTLASAIDHVRFVVGNLDIVSLEDTAEHLETLLAAMQIAAGKKAQSKPAAEEVEGALDGLRFLDTEGVFNGLNESIQEALAVVEEWQSH